MINEGGANMKVLLFMSMFWTLYGIAGLFGIQNIPKKFKGYSWTKEYIHRQGISWLMLGVPLLSLYLIVSYFIPESDLNAELLVVVMLVLAVPSVIYTFVWEKKYEKILKGEKN